MLRFIREQEVAKAFAVAVRKDKQARIAVAFWGQGAAKKLGLSRGVDVRIVCNLDHVGCNPYAVQELLDIGIQVRTHPRLHAKVYSTEKVCIVGSSNASTNGLTVEGEDAVGWREANILSDDPDLVRNANGFFDEMWGGTEARTVKSSDIKAALDRRGAVRPWIIDPPHSKTLIAACRERPELFKDVIVIAYCDDLSPTAKKELAAFKERALAPEHGSELPNFKRAWGYQVGKIAVGTWIVDMDCRSDARPPKIWGCSKSVGVEIQLEDEELLTVTPRGVVKVVGRRFPFPPLERALLEAAGKQIVEAGKKAFVPLPQAIEIADRVAGKQTR